MTKDELLVWHEALRTIAAEVESLGSLARRALNGLDGLIETIEGKIDDLGEGHEHEDERQSQ